MCAIYNSGFSEPPIGADALPDRRPIPGWALTQVSVNTGRSNYRALETAFTRRMSSHYQYSITYTLAGLWDDDPQPYAVDCTRETAESWCTMGPVPFAVAKDLGGEYGLATSDQRHRAVFNGIFELPQGFLVSGLYFYGSGARFAPTSGGDRRAKQFRRAGDSSRRPSCVEDVPARRPREDRGLRRFVQPVQSRELQHLHAG